MSMTDFKRGVFIILTAAAVAAATGCNSSLARLNQTHHYRIGNANYRAYEALSKQLKSMGGYRGYRRGQLHFMSYDTRAGYGLYYAVMPGKGTKFNVQIPCIISPDTCLMSVSFEGKLEGDTARLISALKKALQNMPDVFNQTGSVFTPPELDSLRKVFLYGGFVSTKPGYNIHFR